MSVIDQAIVSPPAGSLAFNPAGAIALPAPAAGDVTVFSFRVPIGYDGIILGQLHIYTGIGFIEGSGDLIWRVSVNDPSPRYLKDCGKILVTLGRVNLLQTVPGGLLLRSGNVVRYSVAAPNTSGALPAPGTGNIIARAHGYFWPRK